MLEELKAEVCQGNLELPRHGLVTWTSGNLSARDPSTGLVVIKPSGMRYDGMTPDDMVVVNIEGKIIEGVRGPQRSSMWMVRTCRPVPANVIRKKWSWLKSL